MEQFLSDCEEILLTQRGKEYLPTQVYKYLLDVWHNCPEAWRTAQQVSDSLGASRLQVRLVLKRFTVDGFLTRFTNRAGQHLYRLNRL